MASALLERRLPVFIRLFIITALACSAALAKGAIVINEIHHDPDVKTELAEFIELHNSGAEQVDLGGWKIEGGGAFTFPHGTRLDGGAFVVAHDPAQFKAVFTLRAGRYYLLESAETITGPWGGMPGEVFYPEKGIESETRRVPLGLPSGREKRFIRLQVKRLAE
mgnify:CR=1 FL=1